MNGQIQRKQRSAYDELYKEKNTECVMIQNITLRY